MPGEESGDWPPQPVEMHDVPLRVKLKANAIGAGMLLAKEFDTLEDNIFENDQDFVTAFMSLSAPYDDAVYQLARLGFTFGETYETATEVYKSICAGEVAGIDLELRSSVIVALVEQLEAELDEAIQEFHADSDDLTVFLTDDGRIAVGRYPAE